MENDSVFVYILEAIARKDGLIKYFNLLNDRFRLKILTRRSPQFYIIFIIFNIPNLNNQSAKSKFYNTDILENSLMTCI